MPLMDLSLPAKLARYREFQKLEDETLDPGYTRELMTLAGELIEIMETELCVEGIL